MKGSKMQHRKSMECLAIEALMDSKTETELALEYSDVKELYRRYPVVYNIIVRNGYPLNMHREGDVLYVTKIKMEER